MTDNIKDEKDVDVDYDNLIEIIGLKDDDGKEMKNRVYADEKGRWLWVSPSREALMKGMGRYHKCSDSQRKDMLKLIADIKKDIEDDPTIEEFHIGSRLVTKEEYQEYKKNIAMKRR